MLIDCLNYNIVDDFGGLTPLERYTYFNISKVLGKEPIKNSGLVPGVFKKKLEIFSDKKDSILYYSPDDLTSKVRVKL